MLRALTLSESDHTDIGNLENNHTKQNDCCVGNMNTPSRNDSKLFHVKLKTVTFILVKQNRVSTQSAQY